MIIMEIKGGIGNQFFQYALGRHLAYLKNTTLKLETHRFKKDKNGRQYQLCNFNIAENFATDAETKKFQKHRPHFSKLGKIYNWLFSDPSKYIQEKTTNFNPAILSLNDNIYLNGYWQSEKYFKDIEHIIRKELTLKNKPSDSFNKLNEKISKTENNSVALHIRHGDYSQNPKENEKHTILPSEYYKKALETIAQKIFNPYFFIFSDDIEWCKKHFTTLKNTYFVDDKNLPDYEALIAMSKCQHQIIANSSFSWWGAWLNDNPRKIVLAPVQWYNNFKINMEDRLPKDWIKINF